MLLHSQLLDKSKGGTFSGRPSLYFRIQEGLQATSSSTTLHSPLSFKANCLVIHKRMKTNATQPRDIWYAVDVEKSQGFVESGRG
jgi:hypothetical protein